MLVAFFLIKHGSIFSIAFKSNALVCVVDEASTEETFWGKLLTGYGCSLEKQNPE